MLVTRMVGQTPAILGNKLTTIYHEGTCGPIRYLEVEVDVGSSSIGSTILNVVEGYSKTITIDLSFLIEAQTTEELPEQLLGGVRLERPDLSILRPFPSF